MKKLPHIGNVTLVCCQGTGGHTLLLLGHRHPKNEADEKRERKKVGAGLWVPPGGGTDSSDKTQQHGAQRELRQETGIQLPLSAFSKSGVFRGYLDGSSVPLWIVHVYTVNVNKDIRLKAGEEFSELKWWDVDSLPFQSMLSGDEKWIPRLLKGERLLIRKYFQNDPTDECRIQVTRMK